MSENGQHRDLRDYRLVRTEELTILSARWRFYFQRAGERQQLLENAARVLHDQLVFERSLLNIAVHDLAIATGAKDAALFVRQWDNEHRAKHWGDE